MHNLKERLAHIQLTEAQKAKIKNASKNPLKQQRSFVPVVLPAMLLLSVAFIVLTVGSGGTSNISKEITSSSSPFYLNKLTLPVTLWSVANSLLIVFSYRLLKKNLKTVPRWQHSANLQELHAFLYKPILPRIVLILAISLLWIGALVFSNGLFFAQTSFIPLINLFIVMLLFRRTSEKQWSTCPHCGVRLTRMQILRKSFVPFRERCDTCKRLIYVSHKDSQSIIYALPTSALGLHNLFSLHLVLTIIFIFSAVSAIYYFNIPYMMSFSDKEEKPW